jgi:hypothetical protein
VAEIASSSASYDLNAKLNVYRRNGVREYVVWRVLDREIDWLTLREGRYEQLHRDASGPYKSEVFPGLWLEPAAMMRGELAGVLDTLRQGLATSEHADFRRRPPRGAQRAPAVRGSSSSDAAQLHPVRVLSEALIDMASQLIPGAADLHTPLLLREGAQLFAEHASFRAGAPEAGNAQTHPTLGGEGKLAAVFVLDLQEVCPEEDRLRGEALDDALVFGGRFLRHFRAP